MSTSLFEIVGPIMVGPSSSHTAGMARIGMMSHQVAGFVPVKLALKLSTALKNTYQGHRSDAALVGGAIGWNESDPRLIRALEYAREQGIEMSTEFLPREQYHPNTALLEMTAEDGTVVTVRGISVGGGSISIEAVDEKPIRLKPDCYHVLIWGKGASEAADSISLPHSLIQKEPGLSCITVPNEPDAEIVSAFGQLPGIERTRLVRPVLGYGATISEKKKVDRLDDMLRICKEEHLSLAEFAQQYEEDRSGFSRKRIRALMQRQLEVMRESDRHGLKEEFKMLYGLTSGMDGKRLMQVCETGKSISGGLIPVATAKALGIMEYNASMGCIVAAPTAGSAGIVPGCILTLQETFGFSDNEIVDAMFVSAIIGVVMAHREVSFSGAVGGCQGEVGVSSAIAAAGIASLFSNDPSVPVEAMSMCMKNLLGLICDPIAGPVEVPCIKRNAVGVANAFISADMACAGIESYLPGDQVIDALIDTERRLPFELRGSTIGGLACAEKAKELREKLANRKELSK